VVWYDPNPRNVDEGGGADMRKESEKGPEGKHCTSKRGKSQHKEEESLKLKLKSRPRCSCRKYRCLVRQELKKKAGSRTSAKGIMKGRTDTEKKNRKGPTQGHIQKIGSNENKRVWGKRGTKGGPCIPRRGGRSAKRKDLSYRS